MGFKVLVFTKYALFPIYLKAFRIRERHNSFPRSPPLTV